MNKTKANGKTFNELNENENKTKSNGKNSNGNDINVGGIDHNINSPNRTYVF